MAKLNKLTAMQVKKAKVGQKLLDGGGLIYHAQSSGGSWKFRYTFASRRREMGLGSAADMSLSDARKERSKWASVLLDGKDPVVERQIQKDNTLKRNLNDPTFEEAVHLVYNSIQATLRRDASRKRWLSPLEQHIIPKIGSVPMSQLTQSHLVDAFQPIWHRKPPTAHKAWYRTRKVVNTLRLMGHEIDPFMCDAAKYALGEVDHEEKPITATPWQEIPELYEKLRHCNGVSPLCVRFAILTGMRGMALRGTLFSEVEGDVWTVPKERMKGVKKRVADFRVPLSSEALQVLRECEDTSRHGLAFPSPRSPQGVSDVALTKVLNQLNEPGRLHGFRTTFRTWVAETNCATYDVAETALAHVVGNKVERTYMRSDLLDQRRILMQKWSDYVTGTEAKVVPLRA